MADSDRDQRVPRHADDCGNPAVNATRHKMQQLALSRTPRGFCTRRQRGPTRTCSASLRLLTCDLLEVVGLSANAKLTDHGRNLTHVEPTPRRRSSPLQVSVRAGYFQRILLCVPWISLRQVSVQAPDCGLSAEMHFGVLTLCRKRPNLESLSHHARRELSEETLAATKMFPCSTTWIEETTSDARVLGRPKDDIAEVTRGRAGG